MRTCGLKVRLIQRKLLTQPTLTLQPAVEKACAAELFLSVFDVGQLLIVRKHVSSEWHIEVYVQLADKVGRLFSEKRIALFDGGPGAVKERSYVSGKIRFPG